MAIKTDQTNELGSYNKNEPYFYQSNFFGPGIDDATPQLDANGKVLIKNNGEAVKMAVPFRQENGRPYLIKVRGKNYHSVEAFFQAGKHQEGSIAHEQIRTAVDQQSGQPTSMAAFNAGRNAQGKRADWEDENNLTNKGLIFKEHLMLEGLCAKYVQNEVLAKDLLKTGNLYLAEHSDKDGYWGSLNIVRNGADPGPGQNRLGIMQTLIRDAYRATEGMPNDEQREAKMFDIVSDTLRMFPPRVGYPLSEAVEEPPFKQMYIAANPTLSKNISIQNINLPAQPTKQADINTPPQDRIRTFPVRVDPSAQQSSAEPSSSHLSKVIPPPAYSDISSMDDPRNQRYEDSDASTISTESDGGTFSDIDDDEARSESSEDSLHEQEPLILERGLSKAEAANIIRGARKHGLAVDLSYCEHSIQISASAEAKLEKVSTVGFEPSEKDLEKIRQEYDRKKAAREADLPHYDRDANTKWGSRGKALVKGTGAIASAYTVIGLPLSYMLAKSAYGDLTGPNRPEFSDEMYSNAARGKAERGEKNHTATGPITHKSKDWLYNTLEGINVHNYEPSDKDLEKLEEQCANRGMAVPIIYKDPVLPENRPDVVNGQRYEYEGSNELQKVCEEANKKVEQLLKKEHEYSSPEEFEAALVDIDNEFVEDFNNAIPEARHQAKNKAKEGYIQQHSPDDLKELQEKYKKEESLKREELKDQPKELTKELDQLKLDKQAELDSLYKRTVFDEQDGIDKDPNIKWGKGFDQSAFNNALSAAGYSFGKGGFHHVNGDEKDKKKPPMKFTGKGVRFRDKPPKERDVKAFAKAAVASASGDSGAVTLKGSEEYKKMMSIELKVEAALKDKSFHIEGYVLTDDDKKEVQRRVKLARDEIKAKKESLSIETVDDKDKEQNVKIESIEPPASTALPTPERPALRAPRGVAGGPPIPRGGAGSAVQRPTIEIPPSISSRASPMSPPPLSSSSSLSSASSSPTLETPLDGHPLDVRRRDYGLPGDDQSPSQGKFKRPVSIEQTEPQRTIIHTDSLLESPASPTLSDTAGDLEFRGKKTLSTQAALSREESIKDSKQITASDDPTKKATLSQNMGTAKANVSEASIGGSKPQTMAEKYYVIPIPPRQVKEGDQGLYDVERRTTLEKDGQEGAIVCKSGAQQREDTKNSKYRSFVPEHLVPLDLAIGKHQSLSFTRNDSPAQQQTQSKTQGPGGLKRRNSVTGGGSGGGRS